MARKMRKFSAGGAQGRYDYRMADIKKDFEKDSKGKSGRALEVLEAKRAQRTADAEDDRAKRMGTDRTATRKAEYDAEQRLSRTRRFGADKPAPAPAAEPAKTTAPAAAATPEAPKAKSKSTREEFNEAFRAARNDPAVMKRGTFTFRGESYTTKVAGEGPKRTVTANPTRTNNSASTAGSNTNNSAAKPKDRYYVSPENRKAIDAAAKKTPFSVFDKTAFDKLKSAGAPPPPPPPPADPKQVAYEKYINDRDKELGKSLSVLSPFGNAKERADAYTAKLKAAGKLAKGGKIMKYRNGGSTPPQPTAAERKSDAKFRESIKDIKVTPEQGKILNKTGKKYAAGGVTKEMPSSKAMGSLGMAKGGKAKMKPAAKGKAKGNPFAATKFGAAMMKKGADAKGRAMPKFAKGGSIDGCAVRGKTKAKRVTMKKGGSC